jgi:phenylalanyl-tRNA synthetase beta chain
MKFSLDWLSDFVDVVAAGGADGVRRLLAQAGLPVAAVESAGRDTILDVEITPNRPDAMSHRGLAREVAAMAGLNRKGLPAEASAKAGEGGELKTSGPPVEELTSVTIDVPRLCRRFGARVVSGIGGAGAIERVRSRLASIGAKPISASVDATNYVLWEIGQPLHAFDLDRLAGRRIVVRRAKKGERLVTLDGVERELTPADVVVADAERAVSLAGVMGGLHTAVTAATKNVLLEAAWWDPMAIRRTSRRLGMHTDASHRFERGADPESIPEALEHAAAILLESAGGALAPGTLDARGAAWKERRAAMRLSRLLLVAGDEGLQLDFAVEALARLGFAAQKRGKRVAVTVPSWRPDVAIEDDLVEEVLRVWGYDRLPSRLPATKGAGGYLEPLREVEELLADGAAAAGLLETMSAPFTDRKAEEAAFDGWLSASGSSTTPLSVSDPLDENRRDLRATLLPGLLDAAARNVHRGESAVALFEVGRVFDREGVADDPPTFESRRFGFALAGDWRAHWSASGAAGRADFFDAKGLVERLLAPWTAPETIQWRRLDSASFTPGAAAVFLRADGAPLGVVGLVSAGEREKRKLSLEAFVGELVVEAIPSRTKGVRFAPYSSYPPIEADLSFAQARETTWSEIETFVRGSGLNHLESVRIVDRYEGRGMPNGQVKTTIRLTFRSAEKTLEQEEVNREVQRLAGQLAARLKVSFG